MNLAIDGGNTRFKAATFSAMHLEKTYSFLNAEELKDFLVHHTFDNAVVSSVSLDGNELLSWIKASNKFLLTHSLPLPIRIRYKTPETLGVDRIAAVCGAIEIFPDSDSLVIDAGTCITYDFVDRHGNYEGGAISPGIEVRFEALHTFTERLPLVIKEGDLQLIGDSTETCIRSGVLNGVVAEMEGIIIKYKELYPDLGVVLCGGDSFFFENKLKPTIFAAPDLVLSGLNRILLHNAVL
jgi:type III pantothenate kinase